MIHPRKSTPTPAEEFLRRNQGAEELVILLGAVAEVLMSSRTEEGDRPLLPPARLTLRAALDQLGTAYDAMQKSRPAVIDRQRAAVPRG